MIRVLVACAVGAFGCSKQTSPDAAPAPLTPEERREELGAAKESARGSRDVETLARLGRAHLAVGEVQSAAEVFQRAVDSEPKHQMARLGLALCQALVGKREGAIRALSVLREQGHTLDPTMDAVIAALLSQPVQTPSPLPPPPSPPHTATPPPAPDVPPALAEAIAHFQAGRYDEAIATARALAATDVRALKLVSDAFFNSRRFTQAAQGYGEVLRAEPENDTVRKYRADALLQSAEPAKARAEYEALIARNPTVAGLHLLLGDAALAAGDPAKAQEAWTTAQQKGASADDVAQRRAKLSTPTTPPAGETPP